MLVRGGRPVVVREVPVWPHTRITKFGKIWYESSPQGSHLGRVDPGRLLVVDEVRHLPGAEEPAARDPLHGLEHVVGEVPRVDAGGATTRWGPSIVYDGASNPDVRGEDQSGAVCFAWRIGAW